MDHSLDHESKAGRPVVTVAACLFVVTLAVSLRIYTRLAILKTFGPDDFATVLSMGLTWGCGMVIALSVNHGSGRHIWTLSTYDITEYLRNFYLSIVFYNASLTATKVVFLLQYYRVLAVNRTMKRIYLVSLFVVFSWSFSFVLVAIFQCTPISDFWSLNETKNCIPNLPHWHIQGAGHVVTDVLVFCLPLPALFQLRIDRAQKALLIGVFSLGFLACAISVVRLQFLHITDDVTWNNVPAACWSVGEVSIGLVCACLPTLRPLVGRVFPSLASEFAVVYKKGGQERKGIEARKKVEEESSEGSGGRSERRSQMPGVVDVEMGVRAVDEKRAVAEVVGDVEDGGRPPVPPKDHPGQPKS